MQAGWCKDARPGHYNAITICLWAISSFARTKLGIPATDTGFLMMAEAVLRTVHRTQAGLFYASAEQQIPINGPGQD